ncbi:hypothetical protein JIG36_08365 [Actinoplanes sp. LDG1-06]|uniref:Uncharacterized protein n=1 Tax=Paractinoplanes ovalisporus TaxID=2810368 RepID=A0ABS2A6W4_9ACTN|nr:hypothetical protein [Actinoplanes ovalisporus]MBM2615577.1 hypothetical protein [Actinoplanes ovalisporus]
MKTRFVDKGRWLGSFAGEFVVRCPRCEGVGTVRRAWDFEARRWLAATFVCGGCGHTRRHGWAGPVHLSARRRCGGCGRRLDYRRLVKTTPARTRIGLKCPGCGTTTSTELCVTPSRALVDDCFGLPLALRTTCAGHTLWAFNAEHLACMRDFVRADLRERRSTAGNRSIASRLPIWLKQAKHRPEALRALDRLERLLP